MPRNDSKDPTLTALDQFVFVTGANGAIGASMMHAYAESGATVIGADRTGRGPDAGAAYYDLDVTDEAATAAAIADVVSMYGRIDALVHAAGVLGETPIRWEPAQQSSAHHDNQRHRDVHHRAGNGACDA